MQGPSKGGGLNAEINVTPLVDVVLVLLIIFMVVTPLLKEGQEVVLPEAYSGQAHREEAATGLLLSVTKEGKVFFDKQELNPEELQKLATEGKEKNRYLEVIVRADETVAVRELRPVIRALKKAKVAQISFAVVRKREGR